MKIDILTLFPKMINAFLSESIIGRAQQSKILEIGLVNIRDFSADRHRRVDHYPYGGGKGMLMQAQPIYDAYKSVADRAGGTPLVVYMSPQGKVLTQQMAKEFSKKEHIIILCGHYEGVDERVLEEIVDAEVSVGDYVMTGGELAAAVFCDTVCRLVPGVLASEQSAEDESHYDGLLEYPQYTRPPDFLGRGVPEVLLSGHHANIEKWRREQSLERTGKKRPDLLGKGGSGAINKIGILGGTFDPIHFGHLFIAQNAAHRFGLGRVIFIPTALSPHKESPVRADKRHRFNMARLAVADNPIFEVSPIECEKDEVSYAVDTVAAIKEQNPGAALYYIIGGDSLKNLTLWRDFRRLFEMAEIIAACRDLGGTEDIKAAAKTLTDSFDAKIHILDDLPFEISSTEIRKRSKAGLPIGYMLPGEVEEYIQKHKLYK